MSKGKKAEKQRRRRQTAAPFSFASPKLGQLFDLTVVGGGMAGVSAILWLDQLLESVESSFAESCFGQAGLVRPSLSRRPKVLLLEAQAELLRKILATGNGRCNLGNRRFGPEFFVSEQWGNLAAGAEARSSTSQKSHAEIVSPEPHSLSPEVKASGQRISQLLSQVKEDDVLAFWHRLDLPLSQEEDRLYPASFRAESVRFALYRGLAYLRHVELYVQTGAEVLGLQATGELWPAEGGKVCMKVSDKAQCPRPANSGQACMAVFCRQQVEGEEKGHSCSFQTRSLLWATALGVQPGWKEAAGGLKALWQSSSYWQEGGAGLVPLCVEHNWSVWQGQRVEAALSLRSKRGTLLFREEGELLFTDYGLSGIPALSASLYAQPGQIVELDLFPRWSEQRLWEELRRLQQKYKGKAVEVLLQSHLPQQLCLHLKEVLKLSSEADLWVEANLRRLCRELKSLRRELIGTRGLEQAQLQRGGWKLEALQEGFRLRPQAAQASFLPCVDATVVSELPQYVAGELVDVKGHCGGYNLEWALLSAREVAKQWLQTWQEEGQRHVD